MFGSERYYGFGTLLGCARFPTQKMHIRLRAEFLLSIRQ